MEGGVVAESAEIEVSISRPQMVRARMVSGAGVRRFYADGQRVSLLDEGMTLYATVSLAGTIDDMVNALDEWYGFTPPVADFVVNDPYQKFSTQIQSSLYKGKEAVNGVECDHLTLTGEIADADVWISIADHLPRRFVATFKDREGSPQLKADFSDWNLAATLEDSTFVFDPPAGAEKIVMAAIEDVKASEAKDGKPHERDIPSVLHRRIPGGTGVAFHATVIDAAAEHFEALFTVDRNLPFQQNLRASGIAVVIAFASSEALFGGISKDS